MGLTEVFSSLCSTVFFIFLFNIFGKGVHFVSICAKVPAYATMEAIVLKKLFDFGPNASLLLNKQSSNNLQGLTDKEMHVMFYTIVSEIIQKPSHVNQTNKDHVNAVKRSMSDLQDAKKQRFKQFLTDVVECFKTMKHIQYSDVANQIPNTNLSSKIKCKCTSRRFWITLLVQTHSYNVRCKCLSCLQC